MPTFITDLVSQIVAVLTATFLSLTGVTVQTSPSTATISATVDASTQVVNTVSETPTAKTESAIKPSPTPTPIPSPIISPCEEQIKEILPNVEQEYNDLLKLKERLIVGYCGISDCETYLRTVEPNYDVLSNKKKEELKLKCEEIKNECDQRIRYGSNVIENKITTKMNDYKSGLTACTGQDVKFSKYSSKIPEIY